MDYIIDTISAVHSLTAFLSLLKLNGKLVTVGLPEKPLELPIFPLVLSKLKNVDIFILNLHLRAYNIYRWNMESMSNFLLLRIYFCNLLPCSLIAHTEISL